MTIIDAHSHLDYISHDFQNDVVGTVCCSVNETEWDLLIDKICKDKNIYGAFGVHPWNAEDVDDCFDKRLADLLKNNDSFMVGEIGLDKYKTDIDKQTEVFKKQLDIAVNLKRTVFLHCVGAWDKILHILKQYKKTELPIIVAHNFNGSKEILNNLIQNYDVYFSVNKIDKHQEINRIEQISINRILVETDAKSDILLNDLIDKIANIKNEPDAYKIIYENTQRVIHNEQIA